MSKLSVNDVAAMPAVSVQQFKSAADDATADVYVGYIGAGRWIGVCPDGKLLAPSGKPFESVDAAVGYLAATGIDTIAVKSAGYQPLSS